MKFAYAHAPWAAVGTVVCDASDNEVCDTRRNTKAAPANDADLQRARLIAAAPDLFAELIYLRDCVENGQSPAMGRINSAINKATTV